MRQVTVQERTDDVKRRMALVRVAQAALDHEQRELAASVRRLEAMSPEDVGEFAEDAGVVS